MKIRNGFVTNSSSSSYVVINIKSKKLVEVLMPFVEMLEDLEDLGNRRHYFIRR